MAVDHIIGSISGTAESEKLACIIFCLIDPIFVATRFCSRWTVSQIGADDWVSLAALVGLAPSLTVYTITDEFFSSSLYFLAIFKHSLVSIPSIFYKGALDSNKFSTSVWMGSPHD